MSDIENKTVTAPAEEAQPLDAAKGAEIMEKFEKESRTRNFDKPWLKKVIYFLCLAFTLYHLAYASGIRLLQMVNIKHHAIHVGLILILGFALYPAFKSLVRLDLHRPVGDHAHLRLHPLPGVHLHRLLG